MRPAAMYDASPGVKRTPAYVQWTANSVGSPLVQRDGNTPNAPATVLRRIEPAGSKPRGPARPHVDPLRTQQLEMPVLPHRRAVNVEIRLHLVGRLHHRRRRRDDRHAAA